MRYSASLWLAPLLLAATVVPAAELKQAQWPSRLIELEPAEQGREPPVVTALGLQAGGKLAASAGDDHLVRIWNRETGEQVARLKGHDDWIRTASFTPDGQTLITAGNDRRIYRWDRAGGWTRTLIAEHDQAIVAAAVHPGGDRLAVVGFDGRMRIYRLDGETLAEFGCPCRDMRTVIYSPDGKQLAAAGRNGKLRIWNADSGEELLTVEAHRQRIRALAYTSDGQRLISASEDRTIKGWNPTTGAELFTLSSDGAKVLSLAMLGPARLASAGSDNRIRLWNLDTLTAEGYLHGHAGSVVALECDADVLISGAYDATLRVWSIGGEAAEEPTTAVNISLPASAAGQMLETAAPAGSRYRPIRND